MKGTISLISFVISLSVSGAAAQDSTVWKSVGEWSISIDASIGNGCFASATWESGTFLRIGLNPQQDNFYMLIGNDKWTSLQAEIAYDLRIQFDNRTPWEVSATGFQFATGDTVYLHASSTKQDFIEEFMRHSRMKISYDNKEIDTLKLTGSSRAFKAVLACQDEADKKSAPDPFAESATGTSRSGRKSADPFAD